MRRKLSPRWSCFTRHAAYSNYMADDKPLSDVKRAFAEITTGKVRD